MLSFIFGVSVCLLKFFAGLFLKFYDVMSFSLAVCFLAINGASVLVFGASRGGSFLSAVPDGLSSLSDKYLIAINVNSCNLRHAMLSPTQFRLSTQIITETSFAMEN